jgi:hypothetical protein
VLASARLHSDETRAWVNAWVPAEAHGAIHGREVASGLWDIVDHVGKGGTLIAKDYGKAFDRTHPRIAVAALRHSGLPESWATILEFVWLHQQRSIELCGRCQGEWQAVDTALPQGDPFSPLGLTAVLKGPTRDVAASLGDEGKQVVFVDDRTICASNEALAASASDQWDRWSATLGMEESAAKLQALDTGAASLERWQQAGVPANAVTPVAEILGSGVSRRWRRKILPTLDLGISSIKAIFLGRL